MIFFFGYKLLVIIDAGEDENIWWSLRLEIADSRVNKLQPILTCRTSDDAKSD